MIPFRVPTNLPLRREASMDVMMTGDLECSISNQDYGIKSWFSNILGLQKREHY